MKRNKIAMITILFAFILSIALLVVACVPKQNDNIDNKTIEEKDQSTVAVQVVAASNLLVQASGSTNGTPRFSNGEATVSEPTATEPTEQLIGEVEKQIGKYLKTAESLISETSFEIKQEASTKEGYSTMMTVITTDINGASSKYVFYFNLIEKKEEVAEQNKEFDDPEDANEEGEENEEGEVTVTELFKGLLVLGEGENAKEYKVLMRKTVETEGNETETEIDIIAKIDNKNFIKIEQEIEVEGSETTESFKFVLVEDGKVVSRNFVKLEKGEDGEINFVLRLGGEKSKKMIRIRKEVEGENSKPMLKIRYFDGESRFDLTLRQERRQAHHGGQNGQKNQWQYKFQYKGTDRVLPRWENFEDAATYYNEFWEKYRPFGEGNNQNSENSEEETEETNP